MNHIVDADGLILNSTLTPEQTLTGVDIVGLYIGEIIPEDQVLHYYECIATALQTGESTCSYIIEGRVFLARIKKISTSRVRVQERDVTGLDLPEILTLF